MRGLYGLLFLLFLNSLNAQNFIPRNTQGGCDVNYEPMLNEEECKQLASTICDKGFVKSAGSWHNVNGGCFVYSTWQKSECGVYFNEKSFTGKFDANHISVCRLKSLPTVVPHIHTEVGVISPINGICPDGYEFKKNKLSYAMINGNDGGCAGCKEISKRGKHCVIDYQDVYSYCATTNCLFISETSSAGYKENWGQDSVWLTCTGAIDWGDHEWSTCAISEGKTSLELFAKPSQPTVVPHVGTNVEVGNWYKTADRNVRCIGQSNANEVGYGIVGSPEHCAEKCIQQAKCEYFVVWTNKTKGGCVTCHVRPTHKTNFRDGYLTDVYKLGSSEPTVNRHVRTDVEVGGRRTRKKKAKAESGHGVMSRDASNDGGKCGHPRNADRVFDFRGDQATLEQCSTKCLDDSNCVAYSAVFGIWCIGCNRALDTGHDGHGDVIAYVKNAVVRQNRAEVEVGAAEGQLVGGLNNMVMHGVFMVVAGFLGFYVGQRGLGNSSNKYNILPDGDEVAMVSFQTQTP